MYCSLIFAERPPDAFFNVQIDISATLAANAAALEGKPAYARLMHDWRAASEKEVTVDGRIAIGVLGSFVEGLSTTASLAEAGEVYTMCVLNEQCLHPCAHSFNIPMFCALI